MASDGAPDIDRGLRLKTWIVLAGFLAVAALLLWEEHRAHLLGALPLVLLALACVLLHLFAHPGHGGGQEGPRAGTGGGSR